VEAKGRINTYTCERCGVTRFTVNLNAGVTPFMARICGCGGMAQSGFYRQPLPRNQQPEYAWYRPQPEEFANLDPDVQAHIFNGGLIKSLHQDAKPLEDEVTPAWSYHQWREFAERTYKTVMLPAAWNHLDCYRPAEDAQ
jgi:hypothetical protein